MPLFDGRQRRILFWLTLAALAWRCILALRTPVPSQDGVTYLWMAQCFAAAKVSAALSEPFSPLWPVLLALPIRLGMEPVLAGKLLGCFFGAIALLPVAAIAEHIRKGAGLPTAALAATARSLCLPAVECYTEPLFAWVLAGGILAGIRQQWWKLGVWSAVLFMVRPEGVLLPLSFLLLRGSYRAILLCGLAVAGFGSWRWSCGLGFDPIPKIAFHETRDDLGGERGDFIGNIMRVPAAYMEAFLLAGALAFLAIISPRAKNVCRIGMLFLLALLPMLTFVVRKRFFAGWAPTILPLAGVGFLSLRVYLQSAWSMPRVPKAILITACLLDILLGWQSTMDTNRMAERLVGEHLGQQMAPDRTMVSNLTRVLWFAGQRPLPPRHFNPEWFDKKTTDEAVQFLVLSINSKRNDFKMIEHDTAGHFARYSLPSNISEAAEKAGIAVFARR